MPNDRYAPPPRGRIPTRPNIPSSETPTVRPAEHRSVGGDDPAFVRDLEHREEELSRLSVEIRQKGLELTQKEIALREKELEFEREKRKSQVQTSDPPPSLRKRHSAKDYLAPVGGASSVVMLALGMLKLVGDQKAEIQDLRAHATLQDQKIDKSNETTDKWRAYAKGLKEAHECRFKQICSGLAHLDYGCSDTDYSDIRWSPPNGSWKKTGAPAMRALGECPEVPDPPKE